MGLFDEVILEIPLPDGKPFRVLQTKDFECPYLEKYYLRADGRLIHDRPNYDIDPPGTAHGLIDTNYHGYLCMCAWDADEKKLYGYRAKFTDGQLVGIESM